MKNRYEVRGDDLVIFLDRKDGTVIETFTEATNLPKLLAFNVKWYAKYEKDTDSFYVAASEPGTDGKKKVKLHRFLTDAPPGLVVDHYDHDTLNNRLSNLKLVTKKGNSHNMRAHKDGSGIRGVSFCRTCRNNPWNARVSVDGKVIFNDYFPTKEDAERAVIKVRKQYLINEGGESK